MPNTTTDQEKEEEKEGTENTEEGSEEEAAETTKITIVCSYASVFKEANTKSLMGRIPNGATLEVEKVTDAANKAVRWYKIAKVEYKDSIATGDYNYDALVGSYIPQLLTRSYESPIKQFVTEKDQEEENEEQGDNENNQQETTPSITDNENGEEDADSEDDEDDDEEEEDDLLAERYLDDEFLTSYSPLTYTSEDYLNYLDSSDLKIQDIRGILGCPHQFLPETDGRVDVSAGSDISHIGRLYAQKILGSMPLLLITPGIPSYMASFSESQRGVLLEALLKGGLSMADSEVSDLVNNHSGKYYSLKFAYTDYYYYLNPMLRAAAIYLGLDGVVIDGRVLGTYNWMYYSTKDRSEDSNFITRAGEWIGSIFTSSSTNILAPYKSCIAIYADCGVSTDDSFSNSTTQSSLANAVNSLSDTGREMNFLIGNVGGMTGLKLDKLTGSEDLLNNIDNLNDAIDSVLPKNGIITNLLSKVQTLLAGGKMQFPEIWSDSSFSRSYSCRMTLVSPSGDPLSVYLNILVPIYHIMALTLPRQSKGQAYFSPFLVRAYCRSLFNIDMGIITDLSITKGAEGEWTDDGLATVAEVSFSIKDMYDQMFMSRAIDASDTSIMSNISELDYIANTCGININDHEVMRTIKMYYYLKFAGNFQDKIELGIIGSLQQSISNKLSNIMSSFL